MSKSAAEEECGKIVEALTSVIEEQGERITKLEEKWKEKKRVTRRAVNIAKRKVTKAKEKTKK